MGIPTLVTFQGLDQVDDYEEILRLRGAVGLGSAQELNCNKLSEKLEDLITNSKQRQKLSINGRKIMENHVRKSNHFVTEITKA
jgi:hypothetical protein